MKQIKNGYLLGLILVIIVFLIERIAEFLKITFGISNLASFIAFFAGIFGALTLGHFYVKTQNKKLERKQKHQIAITFFLLQTIIGITQFVLKKNVLIEVPIWITIWLLIVINALYAFVIIWVLGFFKKKEVNK